MKRFITEWGLIIFVILGLGLFLGNKYRLNVEAQSKAYTEKMASAKVDKHPTVQGLWIFTNKEREKAGLQPLPLDPRLNASAQMKADDEAKYGYFSHENPTTGMHGYEYIVQQGIPNCRGSENLTENVYQNTSLAAINAFMHSPPHRAAILNQFDTAVGFGINGQHIVQHFCMSK